MDNPEYELGMQAARDGVPATDCPFAFARINVPQERFDQEYHPRLNRWMAGWNAQHKAAETMPYQQAKRATPEQSGTTSAKEKGKEDWRC